MRTIAAPLAAALASGSYEPYIKVTFKNALLRNPDGTFYEGFGPSPHTTDVLKFWLTDEETEITIEKWKNSPNNYGRFYISRGAIINGTPSYIDSGYFYAREIRYDGRLVTIKGSIYPQDYAVSSTQTTYQTIIEDILDKMFTDATYENPAATWLSYQFYPTGKYLNLNQVERLTQILKQKYFIFFCQNGWTGGRTILKFFIGTETKASIDYEIEDQLFAFVSPYSLSRQYISRTESETLVRSGNLYDPIHNLGFLHSTASHPAHITAPVGGTAKIPIDLKCETGDYITINPSYLDLQTFTGRIQVKEIFDTSKHMTWYLEIKPLEVYSNTEAGGLPSTVLQVSSYIPLVTTYFDRYLTTSVNNLQALAEAVDELIPITSATIYHSAAQSIADNTWTNTAFDSELKDASTWHDTATNNDRVYLPAGEYEIFVQAAKFANNAVGVRGLRIRDSDGNTWNENTVATLNGLDTPISLVGQRTITGTGKYIYLQAFQNSGAALNLNAFLKLTINQLTKD